MLTYINNHAIINFTQLYKNKFIKKGVERTILIIQTVQIHSTGST